MYIFNRFLNSLINKLTWIALILFIGLICFFTGLWITDAATEVSTWRSGYNSTHDTDTLTANPSYSYEEYDSDKIRDFIFNVYNEKFYEDTITINDFYKIYNYVVVAESPSTIRVYLQNYNILMDYQGLSPIEGNDTKFFFYNEFGWYRDAPVTYYYGSYGIFYNTYIDINYNTDTYVVYNDTLFSNDVYYYKLSSINSSSSYNFNLLDSYNNNFAFIEQFSIDWQSLNSFKLMENVPSYYYPEQNYSLPTLPQTGFSATPPGDDTGGGGSTDNPGVDLGGIEDKLDKIDGTLTDDNIDDSKETIENIINSLDSDYGAFTDFVLLPINFISSMLEIDNYCYSLDLNINFLNNSKNVSIPNGCHFWSLFPSSVITLYHMVVYGIYCYSMGIFLFKWYEKFKSPNSSEVKTLDL